MAIFLFNAVALVAALQTPAAAQPVPPPRDTVAMLWARVQGDSQDVRAWFELGRKYLRRREAGDTARDRARLDTADATLGRVIELDEGALGDSARTFLVFSWGARALLAWSRVGIEGAADVWAHRPASTRLTAELQELGENLLRACPSRGVLITAGPIDTYAAWYLQFSRRLRRDLVVVPLEAWQNDSLFRRRVATELRLAAASAKGREDVDARLLSAGTARPLCASMVFDRPPLRRARWSTRPLVWVSGRVGTEHARVEDFVFAALRLSLDGSDTWAPPALALYRRSAAATPALCRSLKTFGIAREAGCR
jgi:hypothetical protein